MENKQIEIIKEKLEGASPKECARLVKKLVKEKIYKRRKI